MSQQFVKVTVLVTKDQHEYVQKHFVNVSRLLRHSIDALKKENANHNSEMLPREYIPVIE